MFSRFLLKNFYNLSKMSLIVMLYDTSIDTKFFRYCNITSLVLCPIFSKIQCCHQNLLNTEFSTISPHSVSRNLFSLRYFLKTRTGRLQQRCRGETLFSFETVKIKFHFQEFFGQTISRFRISQDMLRSVLSITPLEFGHSTQHLRALRHQTVQLLLYFTSATTRTARATPLDTSIKQDCWVIPARNTANIRKWKLFRLAEDARLDSSTLMSSHKMASIQQMTQKQIKITYRDIKGIELLAKICFGSIWFPKTGFVKIKSKMQVFVTAPIFEHTLCTMERQCYTNSMAFNSDTQIVLFGERKTR